MTEHGTYKPRVRIYKPEINHLKREVLEMVVAGVTGLEPAASGVTGRRSNRLSYTPLRAGARPEAILSWMYGLGFGKSR